MVRIAHSTRATGRPARRGVTKLGAAVAVTSCLVAAGCGSPTGSSGGTAAGFPRTIQHAMGSTKVESQPKTVAALDASFVEAAIALQTKVVAYTKYKNYDKLPDYLGKDATTYGKDAVAIGSLEAPDPEKLYDIKPDLIVSAKIRHEKYYSKFTNVAPTVFSANTGASWKTNIRLLGKALGKESLAEQKIKAYEARAKRIGTAIKAKHGPNTTVSVVRFVAGEPTVRLYSSNSYPGIVMADAGLTRPAGQPDSKDKISNDLSQEDILKLDASRLFVSTWQDPSKPAADPKAPFEANPLWKKLKGKRVPVSDNTWFTAVSLQGADQMLTDMAKEFGVSPT